MADFPSTANLASQAATSAKSAAQSATVAAGNAVKAAQYARAAQIAGTTPGPQGITGPSGTNGTNGATGPVGPPGPISTTLTMKASSVSIPAGSGSILVASWTLPTSKFINGTNDTILARLSGTATGVNNGSVLNLRLYINGVAQFTAGIISIVGTNPIAGSLAGTFPISAIGVASTFLVELKALRQTSDPFTLLNASVYLLGQVGSATVIGDATNFVDETQGSMSLQNSNTVAITGGTITGLPTPTNPSDVAIKSYIDAGGLLAVSNIAALSALTDSTMRSGAYVWVASKKAPYTLDTVATGTTDGNFTVATLSGTGRWIRDLVPVPDWQQAAINGTGLFIDPAAGNDENVGTSSGAPIKSSKEFCARMFGAVFATTSPRLTYLTSVTITEDVSFWGFACREGTPLMLIGTETVVVASMTLTAAVNQNVTVSQGSITNTVTDMLTNSYESSTTKSYWVKRPDTSGTATTYAPIYRARNSGGNFSADIATQRKVNNTTLANSAITQQFAVSDVVSIVTFPSIKGIDAPSNIAISFIKLDIAGVAVLHGGSFGGSCVGIVGTTTLNVGLINASSVICPGTLNLNGNTRAALTVFHLGCRTATGAMNPLVGATFSWNGGSIDNGQCLTAGNNGYTVLNGSIWVQQCTGNYPFVSDQLGVTQWQTGTIGVGASVMGGFSVNTGGKCFGASAFGTSLNVFTSSTPYQVDATNYSLGQLGVYNANTDSGIYL